MFLRNRQKGQSTVEYIVLVTGVIVILIAFLVSDASPFKQRMNASMDQVTQQANSMAGKLVTAQDTFTTTTVNTNIFGNQANQGLCTGNQRFNPATNNCEG